MKADVWILAEPVAGRLRPVSHELLGWGRKLADKSGARLAAVVIGAPVAREDLNELIARGADLVYLAEDDGLGHFSVEPCAAVLIELVRREQPQILIAAATTNGRTLMPYAAMRLRAGLTADCTGLDIEEGTGLLLQTRPAIGGNVMATIKTAQHRPQMATVRPHSLPPPPRDPSRRGEIVAVKVAPEQLRARAMRLDFRPIAQEQIDLQDARIIVSGGRGLKKAENFRLVRELADALGAAVGASREAVDRGWIAYPHQVGLSGKTVTPEWYFALGISGAIQHLAGMKTAEHVVAVNSDPSAQILQVSDFGVVGDLFEIVPALVRELKRRGPPQGAKP